MIDSDRENKDKIKKFNAILPIISWACPQAAQGVGPFASSPHLPKPCSPERAPYKHHRVKPCAGKLLRQPAGFSLLSLTLSVGG